MSIYLKSSIEPSEDGLSSKQVRIPAAAEPVEVELAEEPADGEKPLKAHKVDELRKMAKELGVKADVADGLHKDELIDVIERMTHSSDD